MKTLSEQIKDFLETSGYTAAELARQSGVPAPCISRIRNGVRQDVASRKADALRMAMDRMRAA